MADQAAPPPPTGSGSPSSLAASLGIEDPRIEIMADYLLRHYRLKPDRWVKFYNNQDNKVACIVCLSPVSIVERVATNEANTSKWPKATTEDIRHHIHTLKNIVDVTASKAKGHTLLRIPNEFDDFEYPLGSSERVDRRLLHEIESLIVMWSNEIQEVLKYRCADPILEGKNPSPATEIKYWQMRAKDFDQLYQQLNNPRVKMMAYYLKNGRSVYYQAFKDLYSSVVG
ncbi:unnamed protein product, partial [Candidula unifasciata]